MSQNDTPLTSKKAAEFLGYSKSYLYELVQKGLIPHYKPTGRKVIFLQSDLIDFVKSGKVKTQREIEEEVKSKY